MSITGDQLSVTAHAGTSVPAPGANREALPSRLPRELRGGRGCTESRTPQGPPRSALGGGSPRPLPPPLSRGYRLTAPQPDSPDAALSPRIVRAAAARVRVAAPGHSGAGRARGQGPPDPGTRAALRAAGTYLVEGQREWVSLAPGWRERARGVEGHLACETVGSATFPFSTLSAQAPGGVPADAPLARATRHSCANQGTVRVKRALGSTGVAREGWSRSFCPLCPEGGHW